MCNNGYKIGAVSGEFNTNKSISLFVQNMYIVRLAKSRMLRLTAVVAQINKQLIRTELWWETVLNIRDF